MLILGLNFLFLAVLTSSAQAGAGQSRVGPVQNQTVRTNLWTDHRLWRTDPVPIQPHNAPNGPRPGQHAPRTPTAPLQTDPDPDTSGVPTHIAEEPAWGYNPSRTPVPHYPKFPDLLLPSSLTTLSTPNSISD